MNSMTVYDPSRRHAYECFGDICGTLDAKMRTGGGNVPIVVETLVFDDGQITSPTNGNVPAWGCCHSLSGNAGRTVVIIKEQGLCGKESTETLRGLSTPTTTKVKAPGGA